MNNKKTLSEAYRKTIIDVAWWYMDDAYPLLTKEETETGINYYLCNKFKIFQKRNEKKGNNVQS